MEVAVELGLNLGERVGRSLIRGGLIGPVGVHDEPRAVVDVEPLLAHGALGLAVALHHHVVVRLRHVRRAVTEAQDELLVTGVARALDADRALLTANRRLVEVVDRDVRALVPLLAVVLLQHKRVIRLEEVPRLRGLLPVEAAGAGDDIVVHGEGLVHELAHDGALAPAVRGLLELVQLVGHHRVALVLVGRGAVVATAAEGSARGREERQLCLAEHT
ncbi:hypothetical protein STCU_02478 [Strigomonas culicis]|uniref:Uncharacterized protein n=1 Tax=Strigomonas culicis TaxID=28005 RepID=S9WAY8_9TRYP|nr:hypothetical protein STCU_02478 [Strigomonas culicis]|eukprot:EPY33120.1 hypothetical protein STCU_02478 [Strigomonas culicis]